MKYQSMNNTENKLTQLVKDVLYHLPWGEVTEHTPGEVARYLISNGVGFEKEHPRWIPASKPPKESGEYIVMILCGRKPITMQYSVENDTWFDYSDDADEDPIIYYHVTHWMPMPTPPKENEP